ncbi:MAG: sel1 repeat family protein [Clostridiales bacterium]|nr:sel1 repeat family protein [Clostridiales bacterium]
MTLFLLLFFAVILAGGWGILSAVKAEGSPNDYLSELRIKAKQGDADAQSRLGGMYYIGIGLPRDYAEAAKWFRMAAEQGDADAQFNLAVMYNNGLGVPEDHAEAFKWCRMAAEQGHALSQFSLDGSYTFGCGVPQDDSGYYENYEREKDPDWWREQP